MDYVLINKKTDKMIALNDEDEGPSLIDVNGLHQAKIFTSLKECNKLRKKFPQ